MHLDNSKTCNSLFRESADQLVQELGELANQRAEKLQLAYEECDDDYDDPVAAIMSPYMELQDNGMDWIYKNIELHFFIGLVNCDTVEADKLCDKKRTGRTGNVAQLCRFCYCPTQVDYEECDDNYEDPVEMVKSGSRVISAHHGPGPTAHDYLHFASAGSP